MKNLTTFIAVASFALSICTIARADSVYPVRSEIVKFADLNTAHVEGAAVLYQRLSGAAKRVCRDLDSDSSLEMKLAYANCVHAALSNAITGVDRPAVTAYAAARGIATESTAIKIARSN
jgi:UrcA family protein